MRRTGLFLLCLLTSPACSSDEAPSSESDGGSSPGTGGAANAGGGSSLGGSTNSSGNAPSGGGRTASTGGSTGGAAADGGTAATGGASSSGGTAATGGMSNTGGSGPATNLRPIPWEGGPAYWSKFPRAKAAGWTDPAFFPIGIWFESVDNLPRLKPVGINLYVGANHSSTDIDAFKSLSGNDGVFFIMNDEWSTADFGSNGELAVGALASDEIDMTGQSPVSDQQKNVDAARGKADGRFVYSNYGKAALGTFWNPQNMPALVRMVDVASDDLYFFTDPNLPGEAPNSPAWPKGATVRQAASYGWTVDRMKSFLLPTALHPTWNFIEYSYPGASPNPPTAPRA